MPTDYDYGDLTAPGVNKLSPGQIKVLLAQGLTPAEISEYQRGVGNVKTAQKVKAALAPRSPVGTTLGPRDPFGGGPGRDPFTRQAQPATSSGKGSTLWNTINERTGLGDLISGIPSALERIGQKATGTNKRAPQKIATRAVDKKTNAGAAAPGSGMETGGISYDPEQFMVPNFEYRDFTGQANDQVAGIYAPGYAAIDAAMGRAREGYNRDSVVTAGLYDKLASNTADLQSAVNARYSQAATDQAAATQQLKGDIAQNYSSTQQQEAALLQQLGQGEAAQQVLGNNTSESAYQQSQADKLGSAQGAMLAAQGNNEQDYLGKIADANRTAGTTAQQGLMQNLAGVLAQYDQNRFAMQGDQAQAALQLAMRLSENDFSAQQANYGGYRDAYSANNDNAWRQAQMSMEQAQAQQEAQRYAYEQQQAITQQRADQANLDRQYEFDVSKYQTDLINQYGQFQLDKQKLDAQGQQPQGLDINDQDPVSRTIGQLANAFGDEQQAQAYFQFAQQGVSQIAASGEDPTVVLGSMFAFVDYMGREAQKRGMNVQSAQRAAAAYWQNFYGKK